MFKLVDRDLPQIFLPETNKNNFESKQYTRIVNESPYHHYSHTNPSPLSFSTDLELV